MRLAQRPLALQVEGHLQDGLDFLPAEVQIANEISASQIRLHPSDLLGGKAISYQLSAKLLARSDFDHPRRLTADG